MNDRQWEEHKRLMLCWSKCFSRVKKALNLNGVAMAGVDTDDNGGHTADVLVERIEHLNYIIKKCGKQFRLYEQLHKDKGTESGDEKAAVNRGYAVMCENVLSNPKVTVPTNIRVVEKSADNDE